MSNRLVVAATSAAPAETRAKFLFRCEIYAYISTPGYTTTTADAYTQRDDRRESKKQNMYGKKRANSRTRYSPDNKFPLKKYLTLVQQYFFGDFFFVEVYISIDSFTFL